MIYLHVYACIVHILCMKMHYYFLLNINHGASQLYLGLKYNCEAPEMDRGGRGRRPGEGAYEKPPGGLQLSSAGTESWLSYNAYGGIECRIPPRG